MKHTVYRFFTVGSYEKKEAWLNRMAARGLALTEIGLCRYTFEEGAPGEYRYCIQLLDHFPTHPESVDYIRFLEEMGIELVGSQMRWAYFRKKASDGPFELFSDIASKLSHYRRIVLFSNITTVALLAISITFTWEAIKQYQSYLGWLQRGFSSAPYHTRLFLQGGLYLALAVFSQILILPIHHSIHQLKQNRVIRE